MKYLYGEKETRKISLICFGILTLALFLLYAIGSWAYKAPIGVEHITPKRIDPVLITLFNRLEIRWYALFVIGGALTMSYFGYKFFLKKVKLDEGTTLNGVMWGIILGILGARIYYVMFPPQGYNSILSAAYWQDGFLSGLINLLDITDGGLAIHGAIYMVVIYLFIWCRIKKLKFLELIEIVLPVMMMAQAIGRWGNFCNHEAYGPLVGGYSGYLTSAELLHQREILRHMLIPEFIIDNMYIVEYGSIGYHYPTFLFESLANVFFASLIFILRKKTNKLYIGDGVALYLMCYGVTRFGIEILRTDALPVTLFGMEFKIAQVQSVLFIVVAILFLVLRRVFKFHMVSSNEFLYHGGSLWKEGKVPSKVRSEQMKEIVKNNKKRKWVIFDCDGTILDTFKLIEKATMLTFDKCIPDYKYTIEEIHAFFGPLLNVSFRKYVKDEEHLKEVIETYREISTNLQKECVKAYDGIEEVLIELKKRGYKLAILSNKVTEAVQLGLDLNNITHYFDDIIGADKLYLPKPDSEGMLDFIADKKIGKVYYVGDTIIDIECGKNVKELYPNIKTIGVTWCQTTKEEFSKNNAEYVVDKPEELLKVIK